MSTISILKIRNLPYNVRLNFILKQSPSLFMDEVKQLFNDYPDTDHCEALFKVMKKVEIHKLFDCANLPNIEFITFTKLFNIIVENKIKKNKYFYDLFIDSYDLYIKDIKIYIKKYERYEKLNESCENLYRTFFKIYIDDSTNDAPFLIVKFICSLNNNIHDTVAEELFSHINNDLVMGLLHSIAKTGMKNNSLKEKIIDSINIKDIIV